jgi:hypothetical protein
VCLQTLNHSLFLLRSVSTTRSRHGAADPRRRAPAKAPPHAVVRAKTQNQRSPGSLTDCLSLLRSLATNLNCLQSVLTSNPVKVTDSAIPLSRCRNQAPASKTTPACVIGRNQHSLESKCAQERFLRNHGCAQTRRQMACRPRDHSRPGTVAAPPTAMAPRLPSATPYNLPNSHPRTAPDTLTPRGHLAPDSGGGSASTPN